MKLQKHKIALNCCPVLLLLLLSLEKSFLGFLTEAIFIKKDILAQVFSCEFCVIFNNIFFTEHVWTIATEFWFKEEPQL